MIYIYTNVIKAKLEHARPLGEGRRILLDRLPNLVVITLLENYDYFVHTLDTIGNQWEIFVYRFDLPVTSLYNNDICEKFMISMNFGDWIHLITHCSMI